MFVMRSLYKYLQKVERSTWSTLRTDNPTHLWHIPLGTAVYWEDLVLSPLVTEVYSSCHFCLNHLCPSVSLTGISCLCHWLSTESESKKPVWHHVLPCPQIEKQSKSLWTFREILQAKAGLIIKPRTVVKHAVCAVCLPRSKPSAHGLPPVRFWASSFNSLSPTCQRKE